MGLGEGIQGVIDRSPISDGLGTRGGGRGALPGNPGRRDAEVCPAPGRRHSFLPGAETILNASTAPGPDETASPEPPRPAVGDVEAMTSSD